MSKFTFCCEMMKCNSNVGLNQLQIDYLVSCGNTLICNAPHVDAETYLLTIIQ